MDLSALSRLFKPATGGVGNVTVQLTFTPALPAQVRTQILSQPLTLTVSTTSGNQLTLTTPSGATFTATATPPLPVGTQLSITRAEVPNLLSTLPAAATPAPSPGTSGNTPTPAAPAATTLPGLAARILSTPGGNGNAMANTPATVLIRAVAESTPSPLPTPATAPGSLTLQLPASGATWQSVVTTTLSNLLTTSTASPATPPLPLPGPLPVTPSQPLPANWQNQSLTLTATGALQANGQQAAQLTLPSVPGTRPVPVTVQPGQALPQGVPVAVTTLATPNTLLVTSASPAHASVPPLATTLTLAATPYPPPLNTPLTGRILTPPAADGTQSVWLASGHSAVLKSSQPLPTGSIIVVEIPALAAAAQVIKVQSSNTPTQQQGQPAANAAAAPVPTQTVQAVVPPGTVVQGVIANLNQQGQPMLTITSPSAYAGVGIPLVATEAEATAHLVPGSQLTVRVEASGVATLLSLTIPPQAQRAHTLGTLGQQWQGLQQATAALAAQSPVQAANLSARLPQISALLPGLVAFTNALRSGKVDDFLGSDTATMLKSLGVDLAPDLHHLAQLQQRGTDATDSQQWRGTLFPYVEAAGEDPRQGGFFWRREKSDDPRSPTHTRFVVEVDLSDIGPMQLDGLVTYPEVWLKLRRTTQPEEGFTANLQTMVTNLLNEFGLQGGIAVETTTTFPINPRAELLAGSPNPLPTTA